MLVDYFPEEIQLCPSLRCETLLCIGFYLEFIP